MTRMTVTSESARSSLEESIESVENSIGVVYSHSGVVYEDEDESSSYPTEDGDDEGEEGYEPDDDDDDDDAFHDACDELEVALDELCSALAEAFDFTAGFHDLEEALEALIAPSDGIVTKAHALTAAALIEALTLEAYGESHAGDLPPQTAVTAIIRALRDVLDAAEEAA